MKQSCSVLFASVLLLFLSFAISPLFATQKRQCHGVDFDDYSCCNGHGYCYDSDKCKCNPGWTGTRCEIPVCYGKAQNDPQACSGNGLCLGVDHCSCYVGWCNTQCQDPNPDAHCPEGFTGKYCSVPICYGIAGDQPNACSGHGQCRGPNKCFCENGWSAPDCSCNSGSNGMCQVVTPPYPPSNPTVPTKMCGNMNTNAGYEDKVKCSVSGDFFCPDSRTSAGICYDPTKATCVKSADYNLVALCGCNDGVCGNGVCYDATKYSCQNGQLIYTGGVASETQTEL